MAALVGGGASPPLRLRGAKGRGRSKLQGLGLTGGSSSSGAGGKGVGRAFMAAPGLGKSPEQQQQPSPLLPPLPMDLLQVSKQEGASEEGKGGRESFVYAEANHAEFWIAIAREGFASFLCALVAWAWVVGAGKRRETVVGGWVGAGGGDRGSP